MHYIQNDLDYASNLFPLFWDSLADWSWTTHWNELGTIQNVTWGIKREIHIVLCQTPLPPSLKSYPTHPMHNSWFSFIYNVQFQILSWEKLLQKLTSNIHLFPFDFKHSFIPTWLLDNLIKKNDMGSCQLPPLCNWFPFASHMQHFWIVPYNTKYNKQTVQKRTEFPVIDLSQL